MASVMGSIGYFSLRRTHTTPWVAQTPNDVHGDWTAPEGLVWPGVGKALHLSLVMTSLPSELLIESKGCGRLSGERLGG